MGNYPVFIATPWHCLCRTLGGISLKWLLETVRFSNRFVFGTSASKLEESCLPLMSPCYVDRIFRD